MTEDTINRRRLLVFWEGTANTLVPLTTQIGLFSQACKATAVHGPLDVKKNCHNDVSDLKIAFDGCGVTHGNFGVLFANGLEQQCQTVVDIVQAMLNGITSNGIHVVAVGLSRGGVACMKLARALCKFPAKQVTCSTLLFDPVPGNAVSTGFPWTAAFSYDLSRCHNLTRVLALYPYEALPDLAMHAPTLGRYNHKTTLVQEDVTMGCHQGALLMPNVAPPGQFPDLSLRRILDFLRHEGVRCHLPVRVPSPEECVELMDYILKRPSKKCSVRKTHDERRRKILRYTTRKQYLNRHHEQLTKALRHRISSSSRYAVYGDMGADGEDDISSDSGSRSYQLDFDDGFVLCPSPFVGR